MNRTKEDLAWDIVAFVIVAAAATAPLWYTAIAGGGFE